MAHIFFTGEFILECSSSITCNWHDSWNTLSAWGNWTAGVWWNCRKIKTSSNAAELFSVNHATTPERIYRPTIMQCNLTYNYRKSKLPKLTVKLQKGLASKKILAQTKGPPPVAFNVNPPKKPMSKDSRRMVRPEDLHDTSVSTCVWRTFKNIPHAYVHHTKCYIFLKCNKLLSSV